MNIRPPIAKETGMYLVNGESQKTSSSHSCDTLMPLSLRRRDWLAAGVRRPLKNASPILSGAGCGTARHALQKLPQSSARFGLSAVPSQAGPTRSRLAPTRKQENRRLRSRRRGRRVRGPRRHENRRTGDCEAADGVDAFEARAGKKTGEQEGAEPTRPRSAPARKQEKRKYFTEVPYASCSHVFGPARGGSACLLSSCFPARRAEAPHASCSHVPDLTTRAGGRRATQARGAGRLRRSAETPAQRARSVRGRGASRGRGESDGPARTSESPPHTLRDLRPLRPAEGPGPRLRRNAEGRERAQRTRKFYAFPYD